MRGIRGDHRSSCRRSFSGNSTWEKHFIGQGDNRRCRTVKELRRNGLVRRPDGIWTRPNPLTTPRQRVLWRGRPVTGAKWVPLLPDVVTPPKDRETNPALNQEDASVASR